MESIMAFVKENAYAGFLGAALVGFAGLYWYDWRFYAIVVPTVILIVWKES